ncbi:hypothetical protein ACN47E_000796 [Coniothyrium glycines]
MDYYQCCTADLQQEVGRRGYTLSGSSDQLSESLKKDDEARGSLATTVVTDNESQFVPREVNLARSAEYGTGVPAGVLVGEKIIYWTMNTFFPTLQLFFESGRSCTICSDAPADIRVGMDPQLRFRLTDCTHEEDGCITKTTIPSKFAQSGSGLVIREATVARRVSIITKPSHNGEHISPLSPGRRTAKIILEAHVVVGFRLGGMKHMAYVWAKADAPPDGDKSWRDVRIVGLRTDIPAAITGYPAQTIVPGGQVNVVIKSSMIARNPMENEAGSSRRLEAILVHGPNYSMAGPAA